jgi:hypothetical protein
LQLGQTRVTGQALSRFSRLTGVSGHGEGWALCREPRPEALSLGAIGLATLAQTLRTM